MNAANIINNTVNGLFMKKLAAEKGWTREQAAANVLEFVTSGTKLSLHDFMVAK